VIAKAVSIGAKYGNIDISQDLPVATTVARHLTSVATSRRQVLTAELRAVPRLAVTTDMWTHEGTSTPYITVTVHYLNNDWKLCVEVCSYLFQYFIIRYSAMLKCCFIDKKII
jgi:hypothetical protein